MKRATGRAFLNACALAALAVGCREQALTQIVVVVDSNWDGFERVAIDVDGFDREDPIEAKPRAGRPLLPRRVALVHSGGSLGPIGVTARGYVSGNTVPALIEPRTELFFERGKTRMLKIDLFFECIGWCPRGMACIVDRDGPECVDSYDDRVNALEPWDGDVDGIEVVYSVDRGDVIDAGADGFIPVPGAEGGVVDDGGPDASDDAGDGGGDADGAPPGPDADADADAAIGPLEFTYMPSNFDPEADAIGGHELADVALEDCDLAAFDSGSLGFPTWCGAEPEVVPIVQLDGTDAVVLVMKSLTIPPASTLELSGPLPVILAVYGDARIDGTVDASAHGVAPGPGADRDCAVGAGEDGGDGGSYPGAGGGGGGGFGSAGGRGGQGGAGISGAPASAASGGGSEGTPSLAPLRGGCSGGRGGGASQPSGAGGGGGGAVQISVAGSLELTGVVHAAGGGGGVGLSTRDGGGGGGSGGAILLEGAPVVIDDGAVVSANGGAGAAGQPTPSSDPLSNAGEDGTRGIDPAIGGAPESPAGAGGNGAARASGAEDGADGGDGGVYGSGAGGGGGGRGRILIRGAQSCMPAGVSSPLPAVQCASCGTCPTAPSGDREPHEFDGRVYYRCSEALEWDTARAACALAGLRLARIDDQSENDSLTSALTQDHWIGANDIGSEGDWLWTDGAAFWSGDETGAPVGGLFNAWESGQPDDLSFPTTNVDCAVLQDSGEWRDRACADSYPYYCEP